MAAQSTVDPIAEVSRWARALIARYAALYDTGPMHARGGDFPDDVARWLRGQGPAGEREARARALDAEVRAAAGRFEVWAAQPDDVARRFTALFSAYGAGGLERDLLALLVSFDLHPLTSAAVRVASRWPEASGLERTFVQAALDPFWEQPRAVAELLRGTHTLAERGLVRGLDDDWQKLSRARFMDLAPIALTWLVEGPQVACERVKGLTWVGPQANAETKRLEKLEPVAQEALDTIAERLAVRWRLRLMAPTIDDVIMASKLLARRMALGLVVVDAGAEGMESAGGARHESAERTLERLRSAALVASLEGAALVITGLGAQESSDESKGPSVLSVGALADLLSPTDMPLILADLSAADAPGMASQLTRELDMTTEALPFPDRLAREALWGRLGRESAAAERLSVFPLSAAQMMSLAATLNREREDDRWVDACREAVGHRVGELAQLVKNPAKWDEVILPEAVMDVVKEVLVYAKQGERVLSEWGFGARHAYGLGLSTLFSGPPGTGKTLLAGLIASELGLDLFRIDLSRIVSKYIGETEQRLARLFAEAERGGVALLFDEADSLFARRTEVRSSNDRYANLEVNFLLQKMEEYNGLVILTTNLADSLDEAFKRRIRFHAKFPLPNAEERERLWKSMLPAKAPVDQDVPFYALAEAYEFSGGEIKNASLRAAFYAADAGKNIDLDLLDRAAQAECRERGRLVLKTALDYV